MKRRHDIFPPLHEYRRQFPRKLARAAVNMLVLIGAGVLYYFLFSALFDTPREAEIRRVNNELKAEYESLSERMAFIDEILDNVAARDGEVFRAMFESSPYTLDDDSSLDAAESLLDMSNAELAAAQEAGMESIESALASLAATYAGIGSTVDSLGDAFDRIPSIQPVINNQLTSLTASFGQRIHPFYKTLSAHEGVDFTLPEGSRVFATADGVVKEASRRTSSSGLTITIDHGNGYETRYNHLEKSLVGRGDRVQRGDIIALSGNTGLSLAPHLHYEVRYRGKAVDPINYFFMELSPEEFRRIKEIAYRGMQSFD